MVTKRTDSIAYRCCGIVLILVSALPASTSKRQHRSLLKTHPAGKRIGSGSRLLKTGSTGDGDAGGGTGDGCLTLYEWSNCNEVIGGYNYTGQTIPAAGSGYSTTIRSFNTPLFTDVGLEGFPVARLRGSYIYDPTDSFATFTSAFQFNRDKLVFHMGFSFRNEFEQYGVPVGGSGQWVGFTGSVRGKQVTSPDSDPAIVRYSICPASFTSLSTR